MSLIKWLLDYVMRRQLFNIRLINHILRDVLEKKAVAYLDDVIIFSDTLEEYLADIRIVFYLIRSAGLLKNLLIILAMIFQGRELHPTPQR